MTSLDARGMLFQWLRYSGLLGEPMIGSEVHLHAIPPKERCCIRPSEPKRDFKEQQKDSILGRYGDQEQLDMPPVELLLAPTEDYMEYLRYDTVIKDRSRPLPPPNMRKTWRSTIIHVSGNPSGKNVDVGTNAVTHFSSFLIIHEKLGRRSLIQRNILQMI